MKLAHFQDTDKVIRVGIVDDNRLYTLSKDEAGGATTIDGMIANGISAKKLTPTGSSMPISSVRLLSPVLSPEKIICVAANYREHAKEGNVEPPSEPYLFTKFRNALIGPGTDIVLPRVSKKVDWEVELAVVMGRAGKYIASEDALDYVAGYAISNDVSCRDFQKASGPPDKPNPWGPNWLLGKSMDGTFPLGPWLVTRDEIPDPQSLAISLSVNGKKKQDSNTSRMIFNVARLVAHASQGITLKPGDIISTGTPHGVGATTGEFLKDGDIVECTVEKIGTLRNPVRAEV
jgi:2-keto-4-pentenoate hydratase/2-oxohepta-3-ene-1,7-dioic acid hydratase in catechol pathway